jgi:hypothetical protein
MKTMVSVPHVPLIPHLEFSPWFSFWTPDLFRVILASVGSFVRAPEVACRSWNTA